MYCMKFWINQVNRTVDVSHIFKTKFNQSELKFPFENTVEIENTEILFQTIRHERCSVQWVFYASTLRSAGGWTTFTGMWFRSLLLQLVLHSSEKGKLGARCFRNKNNPSSLTVFVPHFRPVEIRWMLTQNATGANSKRQKYFLKHRCPSHLSLSRLPLFNGICLCGSNFFVFTNALKHRGDKILSFVSN